MTLRKPLFFGACFVALAGLTVAQDSAPARTPKPEPTTARAAAVHPEGIARASDIIGKHVVDGANEIVGEIKDLITWESGDVVVLIEPVGSEALVAVPLGTLSPRLSSGSADVVATDTLHLDRFVYVGEVALVKAPLVGDRMRLEGSWWIDYTKTFGVEPKAPTEPASSDKAAAHTPASPAGHNARCLDALLGQDVKSLKGDSIGDVRDFAVDLGNSQLAYAIIATGGTLGIGATLHCVHAGALEPDSVKKFCTLNADKAALEHTASVDIDKLPSRPNLEVGMAAPAATDRSTKERAPPR